MGKLFVLLIGVCALYGAWLGIGSVMSHDVHNLGVAFGIDDDETIEMHTIVGIRMKAIDPPKLKENLTPDIKGWIRDHFSVTDSQGNSVDLALRDFTSVIPKHKIKGTPDGFLLAKLHKGREYTFEYTPIIAEGKVYSWSFTAPSSPQPLDRPAFMLK